MALRELNSIAEQFLQILAIKNDFKKFYKKIEDVLVNKVLDKEELDEDFKDIVVRVLARLNEVSSIEGKCVFRVFKKRCNYI